MGIDRGVAGAAFATPVLSVSTVPHATPINSEDKILGKCLKKKKKRDEICAKKMHKIAPFFQ